MKEILEHLRTIHFAMMATCFGLVVVVASRLPVDIDETLDEFRTVEQAVEGIRGSPGTLNDLVAMRAQDALRASPRTSSKTWLVLPDDPGPAGAPPTRFASVTAALPKLGNTLLNPIARLSVDDTHSPKLLVAPFQMAVKRPSVYPAAREDLQLPIPNSWNDVERLIVALKDGLTAHVARGLSRTFRLDGEEVSDPWIEGESKGGIPLDWACDLDLRPRETVWVYEGNCVRQAVANAPVKRLMFRADVLAVELTGTSLLTRVLGHDIDPNTEPFPHLKAFVGGDGEEDLKTLGRRIEATKSPSPDGYEIVGVKIPFRQVSVVGTLVVLLLQAYFLVHLQQATKEKQQTKGESVAWIGIYQTTLARLLFVGSAILLPPLAAMLSAQGFWKVLAVALSTCLAAPSARLWWQGIQTWKQESPQPHA